MQTRPPKFKKKIAALLREVLLESKEFASAYSAVVERRKPQKKLIIESASDEEESKAEFYDETTEVFKSALSKIPDSLLDLLDSQFRAKPTVLVAGGIVPDAYESSPADESGEASESSAQTNQFIEEEDEQD